jgi:hypothetical protein
MIVFAKTDRVCAAARPLSVSRLLALAAMAVAQASGQQPGAFTQELEEYLFVQRPAPPPKTGMPGTPGSKPGPLAIANAVPGFEGGVLMAWIPQPLQKYCLGKTIDDCSSMDYCIRTTNKNVPMCRSLSIDLTRLPTYPADLRPRRILSIVLIAARRMPGMDTAGNYFANAPPETLRRLSLSARVKARIKFTRSADDDQFNLLEVLAVPPF